MGWEKVVGAGILALVSAGAAYWKRDDLKEAWDNVVIGLTGKRVAVLGERNVGKTVLLKFLANGEIPSEYMQTLLPEKVEGNRFSIGDLRLNLKETRDLPGGLDAIKEWKALYENADIVLYLVNARQVNKHRIRRDLTELVKDDQEGGRRPQLVVIVTHMDLDPTYAATPASARGTFRDEFVMRHLDAGLSTLRHRPRIILGSLVDHRRAEELVGALIRTLAT